MEKFSLNEMQASLLEQKVIDLQGQFDDEMFQYVRDALLLLSVKGNPAIRVQISSGGGDATVGLVIYDMLRHYQGETTGVVVGFAKSAAVLVLQACTTRLCTQNSFLLVHEVYRDRVFLNEMENDKKRAKMVAAAKRKQTRIYLILEKRTGKSRERIAALCRKGNTDKVLTAEEALKFGLIDKIT